MGAVLGVFSLASWRPSGCQEALGYSECLEPQTQIRHTLRSGSGGSPSRFLGKRRRSATIVYNSDGSALRGFLTVDSSGAGVGPRNESSQRGSSGSCRSTS
ncbi:hypothetical protein H8959_022674 [Pygathrix nigripes]